MPRYQDDQLHIWDAPNSPGEPVCISGSEHGYGVHFYYHEGELVGMLLYGEGGYLGGWGLVPAEELLNAD